MHRLHQQQKAERVKGTCGEHRQMDMSGHGKYLSEQGQDGEVTVIVVVSSLSLLSRHHYCCCRCCYCHIVVVVALLLHCCCIVVVLLLLLLLLLLLCSSHPFGAHRDAGPRVSAGGPSSVACDAAAI